MENQQGTGIAFAKFTWTIDSFSKKTTKKLRSKSFEVGGCRWRILVHPIGKGVDHLSLYLKVAGSRPSYRWRKFAHIRLALINQMDSKKSVVRETQQKFNAGYRCWGSLFVHLSDFYNPNQGYLVNNICIIEAHVSISDVEFKIQDNFTKISTPSPTHEPKAGQTEMEHMQLEDQVTHNSKWDQANQTGSELQPHEDQGIAPSDETICTKQLYPVPTAPPLYPSIYDDDRPEEVPLSELLNVKSLGPEAAAFFPLLVEVCSWHPSLIESQRKRSPEFIQWAFTALGQVLYFLKTMKVKNMDDNACGYLQDLWDELQFFGFDLTWLEPYIQSALGVKAYLKPAEQVKKLKENVDALEIEMKKLRVKLAVAEVDREVERRDLAEVEKGFEERDMDAQLGYGIY